MYVLLYIVTILGYENLMPFIVLQAYTSINLFISSMLSFYQKQKSLIKLNFTHWTPKATVSIFI